MRKNLHFLTRQVDLFPSGVWVCKVFTSTFPWLRHGQMFWVLKMMGSPIQILCFDLLHAPCPLNFGLAEFPKLQFRRIPPAYLAIASTPKDSWANHVLLWWQNWDHTCQQQTGEKAAFPLGWPWHHSILTLHYVSQRSNVYRDWPLLKCAPKEVPLLLWNWAKRQKRQAFGKTFQLQSSSICV